MEKLGVNEIREKFLSFFETKGCLRLNSFPLIPNHDKSLLIINSGMAPMKPWFSGVETPPRKRVTTCQKCIRTDDIENVGITDRHGTFFEMMGNFSFGDYFKKEAIAWAYEFCRDWLKLPMDKVWATVYQDDDEALELWVKTGIPRERIVKLGKDDNFWQIGTGPCGPCSELYFDRGEEHGCGRPDCKPGCECDRYIEFWNLVFTQFDAQEDGTYEDLEHPNIDTGMGLERMACVMQDTLSIFDVDTIRTVIEKVEEVTGAKYEDSKSSTDTSIRIITDHTRAATFMISDNIMPSNEGRGYVLRRLLRRAAGHGRKLGMEGPFLSKIADAVIETSSGAYPELENKKVFIEKIIEAEENKFLETLGQGLELIRGYLEEMEAEGKEVLDGEKAFRLHDTFGFPLDLAKELIEEKGFSVDVEGFNELMEKQKAMGKADAAEVDVAWQDTALNYLFEEPTEFTGYEAYDGTGVVRAIFRESDVLDSLGEDSEGRVILDTTPFYAESGGQIADTGVITGDGLRAYVRNVQKINDVYVHDVYVAEGELKTGSEVRTSVDKLRRNATSRNHSATHLLHQGLRDVLGDHVQQAGSKVGPDELRFDFTHYEALSPEQIREVENIVNDKIDAFLPVTTDIVSLKEASSTGAIGLFDEKYGDDVRVVSMGDFSKELCGGIHVKNTGQIGALKIISESGVASGIRRITAISGRALLERANGYEEVINGAARALKSKPEHLTEKIEQMRAENLDFRHKLESVRAQSLNTVSDELVREAKDVNGVRLITKLFEGYTADDLRRISDDIKAKNDNIALVLATKADGRLMFLVSLTDDVVAKGYHAGRMIKQIAAAAGGGGGGKADMAQAGAKDASKAEEALSIAEKLM